MQKKSGCLRFHSQNSPQGPNEKPREWLRQRQMKLRFKFLSYPSVSFLQACSKDVLLLGRPVQSNTISISQGSKPVHIAYPYPQSKVIQMPMRYKI